MRHSVCPHDGKRHQGVLCARKREGERETNVCETEGTISCTLVAGMRALELRTPPTVWGGGKATVGQGGCVTRCRGGKVAVW